MPLKRRVPKRGFTNIFRKEWSIVNLRDLERLEGVQDVTPAVLIQSGLVPAHGSRIKVLAEGVLSRPLHVQAHQVADKQKQKWALSCGLL